MRKRKDSFFGMHFDFHAVAGQTVGEDFRPHSVAELLDRAKPDYIQCDTKGHYGISSYPTKAGQAAVIKEDVLKMWRDLTKERDIALYGHHSGIFDFNAAERYPEWAIRDENGNVSKCYMSVFSPYADEILIPQLKELAIDYELDGAWIDGECWAAYVDYSEYAKRAYCEKFKKEPPMSSDDDYEHYKEFCRQGFEAYVAHYIEEIKKVKPDFEITSNWMYSAYMPGKAGVAVDFLSGDYSPTNSVETARHEARCLAARNLPWDLLAWGQNATPFSYTATNRSTKEYEQYCQEAAMVISQGGGFSFFNIMYGGGGMVQPWAIPMWEKVAAFCREREFCHKAKSVHQIGIIYPDETATAEKEELYSHELEGFKGLCSWNNCMLDCGFSTEVIYESEPERLCEYPMVVLPGVRELSEERAELFVRYANNGGKLIVDLKSASAFSKLLGFKITEKGEKLVFIEGNEALAAAECDFAEFDGGFDTFSNVYETNYFTDKKLAGAVNKKIGKGSITFMCMDFAGAYKNNVTTAIKDFMKNIISKTGFEPIVRISGSGFAELSLTEKEGKLIVNIVNTAGQGGLENVRGYNEVPKIGPVRVKAKIERPAKITRMPEGREMIFDYKDGCAEFEFDIIHIHTAAVIEF